LIRSPIDDQRQRSFVTGYRDMPPGSPQHEDIRGRYVPGLLHPAAAARFLDPATGAGLDAWQAGRYKRGEISQRPGYTGNPFRPR